MSGLRFGGLERCSFCSLLWAAVGRKPVGQAKEMVRSIREARGSKASECRESRPVSFQAWHQKGPLTVKGVG